METRAFARWQGPTPLERLPGGGKIDLPAHSHLQPGATVQAARGGRIPTLHKNLKLAVPQGLNGQLTADRSIWQQRRREGSPFRPRSVVAKATRPYLPASLSRISAGGFLTISPPSPWGQDNQAVLHFGIGLGERIRRRQLGRSAQVRAVDTGSSSLSTITTSPADPSRAVGSSAAPAPTCQHPSGHSQHLASLAPSADAHVAPQLRF
jgi:hypothetical protein